MPKYSPYNSIPTSHIKRCLLTFGPKRDENGEWRRLHNEELHSLYRSPDIVRLVKSVRLRWAGHVTRMEEGTSVFKILTGKPKRKISLRRPRRRLEENI